MTNTSYRYQKPFNSDCFLAPLAAVLEHTKEMATSSLAEQLATLQTMIIGLQMLPTDNLSVPVAADTMQSLQSTQR